MPTPPTPIAPKPPRGFVWAKRGDKMASDWQWRHYTGLRTPIYFSQGGNHEGSPVARDYPTILHHFQDYVGWLVPTNNPAVRLTTP